MKTTVLSLAAALVMAGAVAHAQTEVTDADGNGSFSMEEMMAAYPDLTEELFGEIDMNDDGEIDADELAAAQAAGQLE